MEKNKKTVTSPRKKTVDIETPPLKGLRVVEMGDRLSGPLAGMLLADQGAEVISVNDESFKKQDPVLGALAERNKTVLSLNTDKAEDRALLQKFIANADIVIDAWGEDRTRRLELDFDEIRKEENPGLVSCSLSAFPNGDIRNSLPGYDVLAGACGLIYEKPLGPPRYHEFEIGPVMNGLFAASGLMAALVARQNDGYGQHVETSGYQSNLFAQVLQILIKTGIPRGFLPFKMVGTPFVKRWKCKGGGWIFLHITLPAHCTRILEILEENDYEAEVAKLRSIISEETFSDPSQVKSIAEAKLIRENYEKVFMTKTAQEWEDLVGRELCCIKVRNTEEWVRDSKASGMADVVDVKDPVFGEITALGPVVVPLDGKVDISPRKLDRNYALKVLKKWQKRKKAVDTSKEVGASRSYGPPLSGIRVLDLSRIIAGPCCSRILAELGADVISVQNPTNLDWALSFHLVFSTGKRSVTLDFRNDEGKETLWKLIEDFRPDALIQNYRNLKVAKAVGVDPDTVMNRYPKIAYTHLNAYGNHGGWQHRPGFEQVVQAVSGIQMTYNRNGVPVLFPSPIIDIGCGLAGAFGTLTNIYKQREHGTGGIATTHLTNQSVLFQVNDLASIQRKDCLQRASDSGIDIDYSSEEEIYSRLLRARDGWFILAGPEKGIRNQLDRLGLRNGGLLKVLPGISSLKPAGWPGNQPVSSGCGIYSNKEGTEGNGFLTLDGKAFILRSVEYWEQALSSYSEGVIAMRLPRMKNLLDDTEKYGKGRMRAVYKKYFPGIAEPLTYVKCPLVFSRTKIPDPLPAPVRGQNTKEVLEGIGNFAPEGYGELPYPKNKPVLVWAASFVRWGYFAWRAGQI